MRVIFIFPKYFEFFKFLSYLLKSTDTVVLDIRQPDEYEYHIFIINKEGECHRLDVLLIGDSDINFYSLFSKLVNTADVASYILVGSCGASNKEDLGKFFIVNEAIKGDRGKLNLENKFVYDTTKKLIRTHKLWQTELYGLEYRGIGQRPACSTNFLNESIISNDFAQNYLFDMETFDFYDVCEKKGVKMFSCVRFVTDYVAPLGTPNVDYGELVNNVLFLDRWNDVKDLNIPLVSKKKYVRLRLELPFQVLLTLNMAAEVEKVPRQNDNNIEKYYKIFYSEYKKKLSLLQLPEHVLKTIPDEKQAAAENSKKFKAWKDLFGLQGSRRGSLDAAQVALIPPNTGGVKIKTDKD